MARRILVAAVKLGRTVLDERQAHHVRDVLRLRCGDELELFDTSGRVAGGVIAACSQALVAVDVGDMTVAEPSSGPSWTIASAVPKAARADWMIEKLSELGTARFVPLATARSVVHPEGKNKIERWQRLAEEAAGQSRRRGVMRIDALTPLDKAIAASREPNTPGWYLSTAARATPMSTLIASLPTAPPPAALWLFIGPEGGWDDGEMARFEQAGLTPAALTETILRVETAAIVAAALVATLPAWHRDAPA